MRAVTAPLLAALTGPNPQPYMAVELLFDSGSIRLWTGFGSRLIDGATYTGSGTVLDVSTINEVSDLSAKSVTVTLSGIGSDVIALALIEPFQRRPGRVLWGEVGVSDVLEVFDGLVNTMSIEDAGDTCTVQVQMDSKLVDLQRPRTRLLTNEMQVARYPGDTFLSYITDLVTKDIPFGRN